MGNCCSCTCFTCAQPSDCTSCANNIVSDYDDVRAELFQKQMYAEFDRIYSSCPQLPLDKYIVLSDLHLGNSTPFDESMACRKDLLFILDKFLETPDYNLILNGDVFELWIFKPKAVLNNQPEVLSRLQQYHQQKRLYYICGNHDAFFYNQNNVEKYLDPLFPGIIVHEGIRIGDKGFIVHGHQATYDPNSWATFWGEGFFRNIYAPVVMNCCSSTPSYQTPSVDNSLRDIMDRLYFIYSRRKDISFITGHTHTAVSLSPGNQHMLNSGCGIYDDGSVTFIEIQQDNYTLRTCLNEIIT